jgi:hypothetical protein
LVKKSNTWYEYFILNKFADFQPTKVVYGEREREENHSLPFLETTGIYFAAKPTVSISSLFTVLLAVLYAGEAITL